MTERPICEVSPPVRGEWVAVNTPSERIPSHGTDYMGQRYAFDLVQLDSVSGSFSSKPIWRQFLGCVRAQEFHGWDAPVHACFDGEVATAADGWADRLRVNSCWELLRAHFLTSRPADADLRPLMGNYIVLRGRVGFALYAHLRLGSIRCKPGDTVVQGEVIAGLGNSGNSTQPHLHFQLMDQADPRHAQGIYCGFARCADSVATITLTSGCATDTSNVAAALPAPFVPALMRPFLAR